VFLAFEHEQQTAKRVAHANITIEAAVRKLYRRFQLIESV